ncbi:MAG: dynamin family protein [Muribaculaceae bacterium]
MKKSNFSEKTSKILQIAKKALDGRIITQETYDDISSRIKNNEFRITIVGEFSSGKSTLIDALIGKDILPHSSSETTATLTYIHSVDQGDSKENTAEIHYSDGKTKTVDLENLKEYVTAFSKSVDVFSSIEYVDVFVHTSNLDKNIVIIDTPGLNGTNHYEDLTLKEISNADASIYVFSPGGIKATEQTFMKEELLQHQNSFFFVMNRIDDLKSSENETVENKILELKNEISKRFFDGKKEIDKIYGVSALKALVAKDKNITKLYSTDKNELQPEDREIFWKESRFEGFLDNLKNYLATEKEAVFIESIASQLAWIFNDYIKRINDRLTVYAPKEELPAVVILKDELATAKERFKSYGENIRKDINVRMESIEKSLKVLLNDVLRAGAQRCDIEKKNIQAISSIYEFNRIFGEDGSKANVIVNNFFDRQYDNVSRKLQTEIGTVRSDMVNEIRKLIPNISDLKKRGSDNMNIGKRTFTFSYQNKSDIDSKIREANFAIERLKQQQSELEREKDQTNQKKIDLERKKRDKDSEIGDINQRIYNLGYRPSVETKTAYREVRVERSRWNPLRWFGDKYTTETESYTVYDDSKRREYDRKKNNLDSQRMELATQKSILEQQIRNLPNLDTQLSILMRNIERQMDEIEYLKQQKKREEDMVRQQRAAGEAAFLNSRKRELILKLHEVLASDTSDMYISLRNGARLMLKNETLNLENTIREYFLTNTRNYVSQIQEMIDRLNSTSGMDEQEEKRKNLNINKNKIEQLLSEVENLIIA